MVRKSNKYAKYGAGVEIEWDMLDSSVFVGYKKLRNQNIEKTLRRSIAVLNNGDEALITDRVWVESDNPECFGGNGAEHTGVYLSSHVRGDKDVFGRICMTADTLEYLKKNTNILNDCSLNIKKTDNSITITYKGPEVFSFDDSDFSDEDYSEYEDFFEEEYVLDLDDDL